jgi:hypothetical protein
MIFRKCHFLRIGDLAFHEGMFRMARGTDVSVVALAPSSIKVMVSLKVSIFGSSAYVIR